MRNRIVCVLLAAALVLGCASTEPSEPPDERTFVYYNGPEPRTIDPGLLTDSYGAFLAQNLFEGLTVWDPGAQQVRPGVAASWEVSDDRRTYTFLLRSEARWSDGSSVTADDFVTAWHRVLNPDTQAGYATLLYPIEGARELHRGLTTDATTFGARAVGPHTLEVRLEAPVPYFLTLTADATMLPVNKACLKKHGWAWTDPGNIVVNGPYQLAAWNRGDRFVLERNTRYWDADSVRLERIVALSEPPEGGLLEAFLAGDLHWTGFAGDAIEADRWRALGDDPGLRSGAALMTGYLVFNLASPPFDDLRVRQALGCALDRAAIAAPGGRAPTQRLVPEGMTGYVPPERPERDWDWARERLSAAGFPGGKGFPAIEIAVDDAPVNVAAMEEVARQWRDELGLTATVYVREWRIHASSLWDGQFQVARSAWAADYPDPSNFMEIFVSSSPLNAAGWRDEAFDDFVRESQRTSDAGSYARLLQSAEKRLLEQAPIVPLYHGVSRSLLHADVAGYEDNLLNVHLLKYLSFADAGAGEAR